MREPKIAKQMSTSDAWVNYILFFEPDIISKLIHLNWALLSSYFSHFIADRAPFFIEWLGYIWKRQKHLFEWRSLHFVSRGFQAITIKAPLLRKVFFSCHNNRRKKSGCLLLVFKPLLIRRIRFYGGSSKQILYNVLTRQPIQPSIGQPVGDSKASGYPLASSNHQIDRFHAD